MDYGIFYGNILDLILKKSILENQGSNNADSRKLSHILVGYSLENQGSNNGSFQA